MLDIRKGVLPRSSITIQKGLRSEDLSAASVAGEGQDGDGGTNVPPVPIPCANETHNILGLLFKREPVPLDCRSIINESHAIVQHYCNFCCCMSL